MEKNTVVHNTLPKTAWNSLSQAEKAEIIKVAVKNNITDLKTIREKYNEFAEGGDTKSDWSYDSWKRQIAEHMGIRPDEDNTYDYEAYFNKYPEEAWKMLKGDPTAHFTDEFKTVYHPTFSSKSIGNDGSIYSGVKNPRTNPQGLVGGSWSPDYKVFTMSPDGYRGPVSMDERKWYLENAEDNGVVLREADGSLPVYDGMPWGGVLPNIIINGSRRGRKFEDGGFTSELDWSPDSWFSKRVAKPDGTLYNDKEAARLASHVPEYNNIEQTAKANGTWLKMSDGSTWKGDPRSWVMMQSEAYKKNYSPRPWYTGQAEWSTTFDYPNDSQGAIKTNKMTRAPYYNGQMWFSDDKSYGDAFAYLYKSNGIGYRKSAPKEQNIWGHNFLAAIPKKGTYRSLASPKEGTSDNWEYMPYVLKDNHIYRLSNSQIDTTTATKGIYNKRKDGKKVLTDDVVNWSKDLGDSGIFLHKVSDGRGIEFANPDVMHRYNSNQPVKKSEFKFTYPILEEFISQPGFTNKVKFIEGNTGDFDIDNPYKYANNFYIKDNSLDNNYAALGGPLVEAAMNEYRSGGKIHIKPENRGKFTALKERTGHSATWFKQHGTPAQKKMAIFALNARKWEHGLGGNLFSGEEEGSQQITIKSKQAPWYSELDEAVLGEAMQQLRNIAHPRNIENTSYRTDVRGKKGGTAQRTYLLPRFEQEDIFLRDGYIKGKEGDYGLVKKVVNNRNLPVWQTAADAVSRETLVPIGNAYGMDSYGYINRDKDLVHAESHPATFYVDGFTGKVYTKGWDLNDYGGDGGGNSSKYNIFEKIGAKILDSIGNPVVVTTGYQEVTNPWGGASSHLSRGATIQDLFYHDDEGYPGSTKLGKLLDATMSKQGLHRENIDGKWLYSLPEITVTGKKKKALGGNLF